MRALFAVLLSLLLTVPVFAEHLRPFIGVGANINTTNDHFMRCKDVWYQTACRKLPDHSGLSLQFEGGVTNSVYSAYLGYRSGSSSLSDNDNYDLFDGELQIKYEKSEITSQHFVIGGRVQPVISSFPTWLRPMFGVGVTYGHATKTTNWRLHDRTGYSESFSEEMDSEDDYGGILEFGASFRPSKLPLQAFVEFELHAYKARFTDQEKLGSFTVSPTAYQYEIRENGIKVGLVYHFKKFNTEE